VSIRPCTFVLPTQTPSTAQTGGLCFEEDHELEDDPTDDPPPADPPTGKASQGLQATVKAEREKRQALEAQLAEIRAAQQAADEASKAEAGQYRELYEKLKAEREAELKELKALKGEKKARVEALTAKNTERLDALDDDWRDLIPEGLSPSALSKQLDKIEARMVAAEDRPAGGILGKPPKKATVHIPVEHKEQCEREASRYGLPAKQYWKMRMKPRLVKAGKLKG